MRLVWFIAAAFVALGFLLALPHSAQADVTLNPPDDSFVSTINPTVNYDNHADGIRVTSTGVAAVPNDLGYLRFDISGLSGTLTAARLRLYNVDTNHTSSVGVFSTNDDDWNGSASGLGDETTITYNNAPTELTLLDTQAEAGGWMEWSGTSLTSYVSGQLSGDYLVTFRLKDLTTLTGANVSIYEDRENNNGSGNTAQLILEGLNDGTPVVLEGFAAQRIHPGVRLSWSTLSEHKHAGFRVLREGAGGRMITLTPELIRPAASGGELAGADYAHVDRYAGPMLQKYWLEDVDTLGRVTRHGPVFASPIEFRPLRSLTAPRLYPGSEAASGFGH